MQHSPIHSFIGVLCLLIGSAIQVHASENTTYVEADQDRKDLGYDGYNVTTFQTGRYLVEAVMLDGSRDRKVVIDTDGQTWAELDVVTELDQGSFWGEFVDQSTAIVEIDGEFALEAVDDGTGTFVVSDSAFDEDWPWASMGMAGVVMADTNLSAELDVLDFFVAVGDAVVVLQNPGAVCHAANCAGGNITDYEQC